MSLVPVAPPISTPVSLVEAKEQLRILGPEEDVIIQRILNAAISHIDGINGVGRALITQEWSFRFYRPPARVCIPLHPVQSLSSIQYFDADNVLQTLDLSEYRLIAGDDFAYVEPVSGYVWPASFDRPDAVRINFFAGYGDDQSDVPENIRHAILLLVAHWFEHRESVAFSQAYDVPQTVEALLNMERRGWYG